MQSKATKSSYELWEGTDMDHLKKCYLLHREGKMTLDVLLTHYPGRTLISIRRKLENDGLLSREEKKAIPKNQQMFPMAEIE